MSSTPLPASTPATTVDTCSVAAEHVLLGASTQMNASTSTASTESSPPSLCPPSLSPLPSRVTSPDPLSTPKDEATDPMSLVSHGTEKLECVYRGRFIELIEQDWSFQDEDAEADAHDESFEIVALPRASISSEGTTSTTQSAAYKALPFVRRYSSKPAGISPSFSTSRLLASLGRKSKAIWNNRKEKDYDILASPIAPERSAFPIIEESTGVGYTPLLSAVETIPNNVGEGHHRVGGLLSKQRGVRGTLLNKEHGNFIGRRLSLRRRQS